MKYAICENHTTVHGLLIQTLLLLLLLLLLQCDQTLRYSGIFAQWQVGFTQHCYHQMLDMMGSVDLISGPHCIAAPLGTRTLALLNRQSEVLSWFIDTHSFIFPTCSIKSLSTFSNEDSQHTKFHWKWSAHKEHLLPTTIFPSSKSGIHELELIRPPPAFH